MMCVCGKEIYRIVFFGGDLQGWRHTDNWSHCPDGGWPKPNNGVTVYDAVEIKDEA
jgi:hypothetical protein